MIPSLFSDDRLLRLFSMQWIVCRFLLDCPRVQGNQWSVCGKRDEASVYEP